MDERYNLDHESDDDYLSKYETGSPLPEDYHSEDEEEEDISPKKDSQPKKLADNAAEIKAALQDIEAKKPVNIEHVVKQFNESYNELIKLTSSESSQPQASTSESAADTKDTSVPKNPNKELFERTKQLIAACKEVKDEKVTDVCNDTESAADKEDTSVPKNSTKELSELTEQLMVACKKVKDTYEKVTDVCNDVCTSYRNISRACPELQDACVDIISQSYHFAAFSVDAIPPIEQLHEIILQANIIYSTVMSTVLDLSHSINNMTEVCQQLIIETQKFLLNYHKLPQNRNFKQDAVSKEIETARNKLEMTMYELELSGENLEVVTHDLENCLMKINTAEDSPDYSSQSSQRHCISAMRQLSSLCRAVQILFRRTSYRYNLPHV